MEITQYDKSVNKEYESQIDKLDKGIELIRSIDLEKLELDELTPLKFKTEHFVKELNEICNEAYRLERKLINIKRLYLIDEIESFSVRKEISLKGYGVFAYIGKGRWMIFYSNLFRYEAESKAMDMNNYLRGNNGIEKIRQIEIDRINQEIRKMKTEEDIRADLELDDIRLEKASRPKLFRKEN